MPLLHRLVVLAACVGFLPSGGCSSSSSSVASPTAVDSRCAVSLKVEPGTVDAAGASGAVTVGVNRECAWTARPEGDWISLTSAASGQGPGTVTFTAAANPSTSARRGAVIVNDQRAEIAQTGRTCTYTLGSTSQSIDAAGGTITVAVNAPEGCTWTAAPNDPWITVTGGRSGTGNGTVTLTIAPNTGGGRSGSANLAGQTFAVMQAGTTQAPPPPAAPDCSYTVSPASLNAPPIGGPHTLAVTTGPSCAWTATSDSAWITVISGASGTGGGQVRLDIAANTTGGARSGTVTAAGQVVSVTQDAGASPPADPACSYSVAPASVTAGAAGGSSTLRVTTGSSCAWTASSSASWITIGSGSPGTGSGDVGIEIAANTDTNARTGTITVEGRSVTVTQDGAAPPAPPPPACSYTVAPTNTAVPQQGGSGSVSVSTGSNCSWAAGSNDGWITITSGASGTGNGQVQFTVAPNPGSSPRTGTLTVAGQALTVTQDAFVGQQVSLQGEVSGLSGTCPFVSFVLMGQTVRTDGSTDFRAGNCKHLVNGYTVKVQGRTDPDGSVFATSIEL